MFKSLKKDVQMEKIQNQLISNRNTEKCSNFQVYHEKMILIRRDSERLRTSHRVLTQGGRGQWDVYYTSPQIFIVTFAYSLAKIR